MAVLIAFGLLVIELLFFLFQFLKRSSGVSIGIKFLEPLLEPENSFPGIDIRFLDPVRVPKKSNT